MLRLKASHMPNQPKHAAQNKKLLFSSKLNGSYLRHKDPAQSFPRRRESIWNEVYNPMDPRIREDDELK